MDKEPKYNLGQKVWFVTENNKLCYGVITMITPVNYTFNYSIKMILGSVGEVIKNIVWEGDIIGDFNEDYTEICYRASVNGIVREIDRQIIKSLIAIADNKYEINEPSYNTWKQSVNGQLEHFDNKYTTHEMGSVEPVYKFGLERDFNVESDLAFILGAIEKYATDNGCYADLAGYIMNMTIRFIEDMRKNVNK